MCTQNKLGPVWKTCLHPVQVWGLWWNHTGREPDVHKGKWQQSVDSQGDGFKGNSVQFKSHVVFTSCTFQWYLVSTHYLLLFCTFNLKFGTIVTPTPAIRAEFNFHSLMTLNETLTHFSFVKVASFEVLTLGKFSDNQLSLSMSFICIYITCHESACTVWYYVETQNNTLKIHSVLLTPAVTMEPRAASKSSFVAWIQCSTSKRKKTSQFIS